MSVTATVLDEELDRFLSQKDTPPLEEVRRIRMAKYPHRYAHFWSGVGDWICDLFEQRYAETQEGLPGFWTEAHLKEPDVEFLRDQVLEYLRAVQGKRVDNVDNDTHVLRMERNLFRFLPVLQEALRYGYDLNISM